MMRCKQSLADGVIRTEPVPPTTVHYGPFRGVRWSYCKIRFEMFFLWCIWLGSTFLSQNTTNLTDFDLELALQPVFRIFFEEPSCSVTTNCLFGSKKKDKSPQPCSLQLGPTHPHVLAVPAPVTSNLNNNESRSDGPVLKHSMM